MPQSDAESSDRVHVPTWALWLTGAVGTMMLAVIIGQQYALSTKRGRPASGVALELNKVRVRGGVRSRVGSAVHYDYLSISAWQSNGHMYKYTHYILTYPSDLRASSWSCTEAQASVLSTCVSASISLSQLLGPDKVSFSVQVAEVVCRGCLQWF